MSPTAYIASTPAAKSDAASTAKASTTVDKTMFMKLLVAQLQNQDPLNPSDGTQFVTQLAQFQQLEQSANTGQDVTAILKDADSLAAAYQATNSTK